MQKTLGIIKLNYFAEANSVIAVTDFQINLFHRNNVTCLIQSVTYIIKAQTCRVSMHHARIYAALNLVDCNRTPTIHTHHHFLTVSFNLSVQSPLSNFAHSNAWLDSSHNNLSHQSLTELSSKHLHNSHSKEGAIVTESICLLTEESLSFSGAGLFFLFPVFHRGGPVKITQQRCWYRSDLRGLKNGPLKQGHNEGKKNAVRCI